LIVEVEDKVIDEP